LKCTIFFLSLVVALSTGSPLAFSDLAQLAIQEGSFSENLSFASPANVVAAGLTVVNGTPEGIGLTLFKNDGTQNNFQIHFDTTKLGVPILAGNYTSAQRWPFESTGHPGLDVTFGGSGANTLTGSFTINDISFFTDLVGHLQLKSLSASWVQFSDADLVPLTGSVLYQSSVPEPSSLVLAALGFIGLAAWRLRRR
jgi:hypothetical protein